MCGTKEQKIEFKIVVFRTEDFQVYVASESKTSYYVFLIKTVSQELGSKRKHLSSHGV